jgi:hypothetical protein
MMYRSHRELLAESMETAFEVTDRSIFHSRVSEQNSSYARGPVHIKLYDITKDDRIGWKATYIVTMHDIQTGAEIAVGFSDGDGSDLL